MDKELIRQAVDSLELVDIYLHSSNIQRFEDISDSFYPDEMFQQDKLNVSAEFLEPPSQDKGMHQLINAKVTFGIRFVVEDEQKELKTLSEIETSFIAQYIQKNDVPEAAIAEFMSFNVVHNVWPFWREYAFRTSSEAHLPRPIIPLLKKKNA